MDGHARRKKIIEALQESKRPISGLKIASWFGVSRQVIVQDVAILRAEGYDVLATARGYILEKDQCPSMVVVVKHTKEQLEDELCCIIDNGGRVRNVSVTHPIYGEIIGNLMLKSRRDIQYFLEKLIKDEAPPLSSLTEGVHMHTIEATNKEELEHIKKVLQEKGYLYE